MSRRLLLAGCVCLSVVVFTHVAERFDILPDMGWGLPDSPGHYLDLFSAIAGALLLLGAGAVRLFRSNRPCGLSAPLQRPGTGMATRGDL